MAPHTPLKKKIICRKEHQKISKIERKHHPPYEAHGGFAPLHGTRAWAVRGLPTLANSARWKLGSFTGPFSRSGSHEPVKCPEAMPASTSTSPQSHSLVLDSGGAGSSSCSRDSCVGSGVPPLHTQHPRFRHGMGLQEGPSPSIPSQLQVQHWLNPELGSERRVKCWPSVFPSFVLKVCSFSHFSPDRQAAMPKDGCANSSCLL